MEKVILGIDPGTNVMGYGIIKAIGKSMEVLEIGAIELQKINDPYAKLQKIHSTLTTLVEQYAPDEMALEAPFFGKNVQSMLKLGRAQGRSHELSNSLQFRHLSSLPFIESISYRFKEVNRNV